MNYVIYDVKLWKIVPLILKKARKGERKPLQIASGIVGKCMCTVQTY